MAGETPLISQSMQVGQKGDMKQMQRLMMTSHMQQALHLLQVPLTELTAYLEEQVATNPLLEFSEEGSKEEEPRPPVEDDAVAEKEVVIDDKDMSILQRLDEDYRDHFSENDPSPQGQTAEDEERQSYRESLICAEVSLYEALLRQARETFESEDDRAAAEILIGYIDPLGFLKTPLAEIASFHQLSEETLQAVLKEIQTFDPPGVGASSVRECLLIQLRHQNKAATLAYQIVDQHYDDLLHHRLAPMQKALGKSLLEIQEAIDHDIAKLDLHPGRQLSAQESPPLIPDVTIRQEGSALIVDVDREYTRGLRLNRRYLRMLDDPAVEKEAKEFIKQHLLSAKWLARNLNQRYSTLERIAASMAKRQHAFFTEPDGKLAPLTMQTVADELDVHESTIARTVSNKVLDSPRGLFLLRDLFTNGYRSEKGEDLSAKTISEAIQDIIAKENKQQPLSDEKISAEMKARGITCARRTIAKYREELQIGSTRQRRRYP